MIKTVDQTTVADIFSINSDKIYRIPKYQREYTWGINDWNALFEDVTDNEHGYFLGSYICVNGGSLNGTVLEVIDGQQRFSTLMLLLTAMPAGMYSLSDDQTKLGRPAGFTINVRDAYVSAGAGFVVALTGSIMTMPGLPKKPAADSIDVDENGKITGLF